MLPLMFGLIAAASLLIALGFLWKSLRLAFAEAKTEVSGGGWINQERARLLDEKRVVLRGIRELKDDLEAGKIAQDDYDRVHRALKAQGVRVLRDLDAPIAPYLEEAEGLVARHLKARGISSVEPADETDEPVESEGSTESVSSEEQGAQEANPEETDSEEQSPALQDAADVEDAEAKS